MNYYSVSHQLVDSRPNESRAGGTVDEDALVDEFRKFPFSSELARAENLKGEITLPTLTFKRESDAQEIGIWTQDAVRFDLCLIRDSKKKFLRSLTAPEVEEVLSQFKSKSVLDIQPERRPAEMPSETPAPDSTRGLVLYNSQMRWLHILCLAFAVGGICFAVHFAQGFGKYLMIVFLSLFSLLFIRGALFGFKVRLASDGRVLSWQEGRKKSSVKLKDIAVICIDYSPAPPTSHFGGTTRVTLQLSNGRDVELPPNLGTALRCWNWRVLRELVAHVQTFSPALRVDAGNSDFLRKVKGSVLEK